MPTEKQAGGPRPSLPIRIMLTTLSLALERIAVLCKGEKLHAFLLSTLYSPFFTSDTQSLPFWSPNVCGFSPTQQEILGHQLGVLHFNSILTCRTWRQCQTPQVKSSVSHIRCQFQDQEAINHKFPQSPPLIQSSC